MKNLLSPAYRRPNRQKSAETRIDSLITKFAETVVILSVALFLVKPGFPLIQPHIQADKNLQSYSVYENPKGPYKKPKKDELMLELFKSKRKTNQIKVLVVDDEPDLVSTIQYRLKWHNYDVITAVNGKEGLEKAISEKPDVILLDTNMPVMNGHQTLEQIRSRPETKNIPVIMVTAMCEAKDIATASSYGISDYVTKPFDLTELMEKITNAMENKKAG